MFTSIVFIVSGLLILVGGGECLLRGAVGLATLARLTPAVIGLTVVAAGTSVPELAVSGVAAFQGKVDITVGNIVGSNIFNIAFILGICAIVRPLVISGNTIRLEYPVLAIATLLCVAVCDHGVVTRLDGILFLASYLAFVAYLVNLVRQQMTAGETEQLVDETSELRDGAVAAVSLRKSIAMVLGGIALLAVGAHATVVGAVDVGRVLGLSERVIGLTIVSIGTSLPEIVTSLVSSMRGRDDVAIGNVIGSNLFNILIILGISSLISPLPIAPEISGSDNWWMLGLTVVLFPLMVTGRKINRIEGGVLVGAYLVYTTLLISR